MKESISPVGEKYPFSGWTGASLFLLSSSTLLFEINLTHLFSVSQFYHFAFVVVSLALLGFGASGSLLTVFPNLRKNEPWRSLPYLAIGTSASILGAYLITNWLPFDSFSIAWDRRQIFYLVINYLALLAPFIFSGMSVSILLAGYAKYTSKIYATNLAGAALGCLAAFVTPSLLGGEGSVSLASMIAGLAALAAWVPGIKVISSPEEQKRDALQTRTHRLILASMLVIFLLLTIFPLADLFSRLLGASGMPFMALRLSPYKSLSYALQYPGAERVFQRWNENSRVDILHSPGIRSLPGLSYRYLQPSPPQDGLFINGDDLSPILLDHSNPVVFRYLPAYLAFQLRPNAEALVLEPHGGLDILTALAGGAHRVVAVESNQLIIESSSRIYGLQGVYAINASTRSYLSRSSEQFDVIILSLVSSYHPVRSGAYSLAEDYRYTLESFDAMLEHLKPDGIIVAMRWLQSPPSESLRLFALAVTSMRNRELIPQGRLVVLRGYNTATILIKASDFTQDELSKIRQFSDTRAYDLDYLPGLQPDESNRYNILPDPKDYRVYSQYLDASPEDFFAEYPLDVKPTTDNQPFFSHFFKWQQAGHIFAEAGRTWQPFGGAGYFVLIALLVLAIAFSAIIILLPLALGRVPLAKSNDPQKSLLSSRSVVFTYFSLIGLAYLFVEIPLIQRFILYFGTPAHAITIVLFSMLLFSGLGSLMSDRINVHWAIPLLILVITAYPTGIAMLFRVTIGLPVSAKVIAGVIALAPAGFLMGIPFPSGIKYLTAQGEHPSIIPWIWGINGTFSVIASILAALLALAWGFSLVLYLGAVCYVGAAVMGQRMGFHLHSQPPPL